MNIVAINRKPQLLQTTPCPICRRPARLMGRIGPPSDGRVRVWISCVGCQWSGESEIDAPTNGVKP